MNAAGSSGRQGHGGHARSSEQEEFVGGEQQTRSQTGHTSRQEQIGGRSQEEEFQSQGQNQSQGRSTETKTSTSTSSSGGLGGMSYAEGERGDTAAFDRAGRGNTEGAREEQPSSVKQRSLDVEPPQRERTEPRAARNEART